MGQVQEGDEGGRGRRKWILIPLILFMLITRLSPAKDFHNNGLVLPLLRGSAGVIGENVVDVELTKILRKQNYACGSRKRNISAYFHS